MKRYYYDLHIHSCLSPCADNDLTPNNIVNMAKLIGLDIIAVADHNSAQNLRAIQKVVQSVKNAPLLVPAIELTTSEDIHVLLYFTSIDDAERFEQQIITPSLVLNNKKHIFGSQIIMDSEDKIIGEHQKLLIAATPLSIDSVPECAKQYRAVAVPAHIDRQGNGIISVLGDVTMDMGFKTVEVSTKCSPKLLQSLYSRGFEVTFDSDSHTLGSFNDMRSNMFQLPMLTVECILRHLKRGKDI